MYITIITLRPVCRVAFQNLQFYHSGHYNKEEPIHLESGGTSHRPLFTQKRYVPQVTALVSEMMVITTTTMMMMTTTTTTTTMMVMMIMIMMMIIIIIPYRPHPIAGRSRKLFPVLLGAKLLLC
jgi:hypothetical protein